MTITVLVKNIIPCPWTSESAKEIADSLWPSTGVGRSERVSLEATAVCSVFTHPPSFRKIEMQNRVSFGASYEDWGDHSQSFCVSSENRGAETVPDSGPSNLETVPKWRKHQYKLIWEAISFLQVEHGKCVLSTQSARCIGKQWTTGHRAFCVGQGQRNAHKKMLPEPWEFSNCCSIAVVMEEDVFTPKAYNPRQGQETEMLSENSETAELLLC